MSRVFCIEGEPVGKGRPKFNTQSGRAYTPDKTRNYEAWVKYSYRIEVGDPEPLEGPVELRITALYGIPKSASKKKRAAMLSGEIRPTKKPDSDNVIKAVADALNGIAYRDDAQVTDVIFRKRYGEVPAVCVEIIGQEDKEQ